MTRATRWAVLLCSAVPFLTGADAGPIVVAPGTTSPVAPPSPLPARYLRTLAHDPEGYDPARPGNATDLLLGDLLFHSPRTLGPSARKLGLSCNVCHPNGATHATLMIPDVSDRPGNVDLSTSRFRAGADNHIADFVNIPSLRGVRFTGPYGRDGRTASLSEFITGVVCSEFEGAPLPAPALRALVHYVQDLDFLPNRNLDARERLTTRARSDVRVRRGQTLFVAARAGFGGGSCATCHVPWSFFADGRVHRLGTGQLPSPHAIEGGYETPTLLGLAETAPYFHDGRFTTLAEVVAWFDSSYSLGMTARDRQDLTAYVEAVGAIDRRQDTRPPAQVMIDSFVYLGLLIDGAGDDVGGNDRAVWIAAIEMARAELGRRPAPAAVAATVGDAGKRLTALSMRVEAGAALESLRPEVGELRRMLFRLAADWAGADAAK